LQSYYEHDYEQFLAVLKKNKRKLAVDPARREPGRALRAEFDGSVAKLQPLREQIRRTDELIDALVYRLYGLTEEEIGIVEGKTPDYDCLFLLIDFVVMAKVQKCHFTLLFVDSKR